MEIDNFTQRENLSKIKEMINYLDTDELYYNDVITEKERDRLDKLMNLYYHRIDQAMKKFDLKQLL